MKSDMAGAATVLGVVLAAARQELAVRVDAWLALAENMPGGGAQRPSDIITMYDGTTVEVTNIDAEGCFVLADVLARAVQDGPDAVIDVVINFFRLAEKFLDQPRHLALGGDVVGLLGL